MIYQLDDDCRPHVAADAWVAPDATVVGHVILKEQTSVWHGARLRGDCNSITLGARSHIQDNAVVHVDFDAPVVVAQDVVIGHLVNLHGCCVGAGSLIGMGATVLNHAQIGEGCLIAAQALIPEGMIVPDRSLVVGVPGRIVRETTQEERDWILQDIQFYIASAQRFRRFLKPLSSVILFACTLPLV